MVRGYYFSVTIPVTNSSTGAIIDVSTWTFSGRMRPAVGAGSAVAMSVDVSAAASSGVVVLSFSTAQTAAVATNVVAVGIDISIGGLPIQFIRQPSVPVIDPVAA
jgi:hypothetical protein